MSELRSNTICALPWKHLATHPDGGVTPCCISDHSGGVNRARNYSEDGADYIDKKRVHVLSLNDSTISEVVNCDYFKEIRLQMLQDEKPYACRRCYEEEDAGHRSKRIAETELLEFTKDAANLVTDVDGSITPDLEFIELRLGNICNLKCKSCNPGSSSKWVSDYSAVQVTFPFVTKFPAKLNASWTESDAFWTDLFTCSKNTKLIYVNGGEPTLVEKQWGYLDSLIAAGQTEKVTLWYNINLTSLPDQLLHRLRQFKNVQITGSVDDIYSRNDYLRTGSKFDVILDNIHRLKAEPDFKLSLNQTVSWMNALYIAQFAAFADSLEIPFHLNMVYDPAFLSPWHLPKAIKDAIVADTAPVLQSWKQGSLVTALSKESDMSLLLDGMRYNKFLDERQTGNKNKLIDVMPELVEQLKEAGIDYENI